MVTLRRGRRLAVAAGLLGLIAGPGTVPAGSQQAVTISATIDGRPLANADANSPITLRGDRPATIELMVRNGSVREVFIRSVRLDSRVVGLTFFAYETRVDMRVGPGASDDRRYILELVDLNEQAIGLLPARLALLDEERRTVAIREFSTDVDGSLGSIYGVFGILMAAITAVLLGSAVVRLAAGKLSANRWKRGTRFAVAGFGLGLTLTFTLSALRIFLPSPGLWLNVVLLSIALLFVVGYLTPTPEGA